MDAYIKESILSLLNQNYQNYEVIILDNNSSDKSLEWIKSLNSKRIKFTLQISHYQLKIVGKEFLK